MGTLLDRERGEISYYHNGQALGVAFKLPPSISALYPAICLKGLGVALDFSHRSWQRSLPLASSGHTAPPEREPGDVATEAERAAIIQPKPPPPD
eukprot:3500826-Prymnesium_polylepis.1